MMFFLNISAAFSKRRLLAASFLALILPLTAGAAMQFARLIRSAFQN
jgi:hypothetical protein